jgi:hypothetical protein
LLKPNSLSSCAAKSAFVSAMLPAFIFSLLL